ncbi:sensor histidine kinase [Faecalicoccus acidiformans]|uniref:ATP-binding protein n=1 Tax=Faecalicoccus acidiformans TaxID=915173 RepID=A0ABS2FP91_9FIRM|nr:ATP-binding protein [Faecalicoccus acidiformans]MBM6831853.1 ATP-binding protein [Faecalicoccus acidiformans]
MEELKYVIEDSTIAELLGVQNFSTDEAAILELVKNAYDANSLSLEITFQDNELRFKDNGIGMNADDIKKHWMHIGKSNKGYEILDENNKKRIQAGSKGVGRFALSRLGHKVYMKSKKIDSVGVLWETDWNTSFLSENDDAYEKGTDIRIIGLREKWNKKRIENLYKYLKRTYHDNSMEIRIIADGYDKTVTEHFPKAKAGINCRSNIVLNYNGGILTTKIYSDEFENDAAKYCPEIDLKYFIKKTDIVKELKGYQITEFLDDDIKSIINDIGNFSADFYFNLTSTNEEKDRFMYKYLNTQESIESGIILYRNAFSISSYEGKKDWLGLGKRSRKSPAAASHPTGAWRVRENQMAGYVLIDKKNNAVLQDMSNRQGLDENIYYQLFVEIILIGIKEFERYRQSIIRKINVKNKPSTQKSTPISDRVITKPTSVSSLTKEEAKQLAKEIQGYKKEGRQHQKDKEFVETRYKYDVRILNVLATTGLKASSIAHEITNDRNAIYDNYNKIVAALKEYGMWEELNSVEKTRKSYKNVPYLLKNNDEAGKKLITFADTMLEEIEKNQFESRYQSIGDILSAIKNVWERDYVWLNIQIIMEQDLEYQISKDILHVIFDNLILNSVQQNEKAQKLEVKIVITKVSDFLKIKYSDTGKGLDNKYKSDPMKILEVHETTRTNGHGLGMWIVNNTCIMSGGEIEKIDGEEGFHIEFTVGGKI